MSYNFGDLAYLTFEVSFSNLSPTNCHNVGGCIGSSSEKSGYEDIGIFGHPDPPTIYRRSRPAGHRHLPGRQPSDWSRGQALVFFDHFWKIFFFYIVCPIIEYLAYNFYFIMEHFLLNVVLHCIICIIAIRHQAWGKCPCICVTFCRKSSHRLFFGFPNLFFCCFLWIPRLLSTLMPVSLPTVPFFTRGCKAHLYLPFPCASIPSAQAPWGAEGVTCHMSPVFLFIFSCCTSTEVVSWGFTCHIKGAWCRGG